VKTMNERTIEQWEKGEPAGEPLSTADLAGMNPVSGGQARAVANDEKNEPLFVQDEAQDMRSRWERVQTGFVDDPRRSVQEADQLVASTIKRLAEVFAKERENLEHMWGTADNVSTEDLRMALRRYRSFFNRLLSV